MTTVRKTARSPGWFLDPKATSHISYQRESFKEFTSLGTSYVSSLGSGSLIPVVGKVPVAFNVNGKMEKSCLHDVLYVPQHTKNLVSVQCLTQREVDVYYNVTKKKCSIQKDGRVICNGVAEGKLFRLLEAEEQQESAMIVEGSRLLKLWHLRLGHLPESNIRTLEKMCTGVRIPRGGSLEFCDTCAEGTTHEIPLPRRFSGTTGPLDLIHSDLWGYVTEKSLSGATCFVTFVDDYSRKSFVYLMNQKNELLSVFKGFVDMAERETGRQVRRLRCSGGEEYQNAELMSYLEDEGILMEITPRDSVSVCHNGVAERVNRTLFDKALSMMQHAQLQRSFWGAAIKTANYLQNVSHGGALNSMTPEECWSGMKPDLSHLRVFGCPAYVQIPKEQRRTVEKKADYVVYSGYCEVVEEGCSAYVQTPKEQGRTVEKKAEKVVFIGYLEGLEVGLEGYCLFNPKTKKVIRSRDVQFDELGTWSRGQSSFMNHRQETAVSSPPSTY